MSAKRFRPPTYYGRGTWARADTRETGDSLLAAKRMPTFLHTCYRIGDIDRSVAFYEKLGFEEAARMPIGDEAINVFMGLPGEDPRLELTYNHGVDSYKMGSGYNHIAIGVEDLDGTLERLATEGIEPEKPPYRPGGRTEGHRICFVRDPDGYRCELVERKGSD
jgi:lactoylglutathione lyase